VSMTRRKLMKADVCSFLFTLEEFARETLYLLDTVNEVRNPRQQNGPILTLAQIVDAEGMSTTDYLRSLWPSKRKKQEKRTDYLYKRFRKYTSAHLRAPTVDAIYRPDCSRRSIAASTPAVPEECPR
jgi:hypothetical protein